MEPCIYWGIDAKPFKSASYCAGLKQKNLNSLRSTSSSKYRWLSQPYGNGLLTWFLHWRRMGRSAFALTIKGQTPSPLEMLIHCRIWMSALIRWGKPKYLNLSTSTLAIGKWTYQGILSEICLVSHAGSYQYKRTLFGVTNAPATY